MLKAASRISRRYTNEISCLYCGKPVRRGGKRARNPQQYAKITIFFENGSKNFEVTAIT